VNAVGDEKQYSEKGELRFADINYDKQNEQILECRPMPNVMIALLKVGGALCSTPQSLTDAHYWSAVQ